MEPHQAVDWPAAPSWSFFMGSLGRGAVFAAIAFCVLSAAFFFLSSRKPALSRWGTATFFLGCASFFVAIFALGTLFVNDQFQYRYVFGHSEADVALKYKVAAIWGGQEGSFLLWGTCAALFGLLAWRATREYRRWFAIPYALFLAAIAGILAYESPFVIQALDGRVLVPPTGRGLAPSLLNYWVTIHPPTIFLGFGSLTVLFCLAIAALASRSYEGWIRVVRPWALVSTALIGVGLCMGGFWAYETLGWGGFWMWDPVENVSFVPWVLCVALVHGAFVQIAKGKWTYTNLLLAAAPFLAFLYGTFLTRSGFLQDTSVHSFAQMDRSALWLLVGLGVASVVGFGTLWGVRFRQRERASEVIDEPGVNRGSFFAAAIWLLCGFAVCTAFGMSVPFLMSLTGRQPKVVEEGLYHQVLVWLFVPTMILMAVGPFIGWRRLGFKGIMARVGSMAAISLGVLGLFMIWAKSPGIGARLDAGGVVNLPFGIGLPGDAWNHWVFFLAWLCLFGIVASVWKLAEGFKRVLPSLGGILAHLGLAVAMLGLIVSRGFEQKAQIIVQEGRPAQGLGYVVSYKKPTGKKDFYHRDNTVEFDVIGDRDRFVARPGYYYLQRPDQEPQAMVWPYIHGTPFYDIYFTLHPLVVEATDPLTFKPGESKLIDQALITYEQMNREGEPGATGTRFAARIRLKTPSGEWQADPSIIVGANGPEFVPARLGSDYFVSLNQMDAADKSVTIQLLFVDPLMPVEIFFKPLTLLVWIGVGIMTFGGLLAAWYRRRVRLEQPEAAMEDTPEAVPEHAPQSVA